MRAVALIGLTVLVLAGCQFGGDSGKAEFIRQADGICARYERQISLIPQPQTFLRDFAVFMRRAVPIARRQNQELRRLKAPEDDDADFQRMLKLLDEQLDIWEAARIAREIGFFSCARPEG